MNHHPSELALEAYLLDRDASPAASHVAGCEHCRARVAKMEREGENFRRFVLPATLDAVLEKNAPSRRKRWPWVIAIAPAAAAAALAIALRPPPKPPDDYFGTKGGMSLLAYVNAPGGANLVRDGEAVRPSAALRFTVNARARCNLWIVSVDETGQVSRIYPTSGNEGAPVTEKSLTLPGGAVLDGRTGLERFYGVCSPAPLTYDAVVNCVRTSVHGAADVRAGPALVGLPKGSRQDSVLVEKRP